MTNPRSYRDFRSDLAPFSRERFNAVARHKRAYFRRLARYLASNAAGDAYAVARARAERVFKDVRQTWFKEFCHRAATRDLAIAKRMPKKLPPLSKITQEKDGPYYWSWTPPEALRGAESRWDRYFPACG